MTLRLAEEAMWSAVSRLAAVLTVSLGLYHLYVIAVGPPPALIHRAIHFGGLALVAYLSLAIDARAQTARRRAALALLGLAAASGGLYLLVFYQDLIWRVGAPTALDLAFAAATTILVLDLARRLHGWALVATAVAALTYALAGPLVPGMLGHRGYSPVEALEFLYTTTEGLFGLPMQVAATYIVVFIIFAAFLERAGITALFNDLAFAVAGRSRGGVAKVAVVSSAMMGTVNGSGLANVTTTGAITVPMMKRHGFPADYAAGIEAAASMGGQIMPPIMGVAAFLMAERLGVPYSRVALAAIVPALLYFFAIGVQIHLHALRHHLPIAAAERGRRFWAICKADGYLLLPIAVLIGGMLRGYSPPYAAVAGIVATIVLSWVASLVMALRHGDSLRGVQAVLRDQLAARGAAPRGILASLDAGIRRSIGVTIACAAVGLVIGVVTLTGAGLKLSSAIVMAAGGHLVPTLMLTMLACFVLGMGLPTIPTYIITSTMAAPALVALGVHALAADFFVMYFGVLANLTPPVALAAYAAAAIAGASPMRTAVTAVRLSCAGFLVPYVFVYSPILLGVDFAPSTMAHVVLTSVAGVVALGAAMEGSFLREATWVERMLLSATAVLLIIPGLLTDVVGAGLMLTVLWRQARRPAPAPGDGMPAAYRFSAPAPDRERSS